MSNKDILLDLFYQCTDFQSSNVDWVQCQESINYELDFAILYVKMKTGEYISLTNQFGNIHVSISHSNGTVENQYNP